MRQRDDAAALHAGIGVDEILHPCGEELHGSVFGGDADVDAFQLSLEKQESVLIHASKIAGMDPAVSVLVHFDHCPGGFLVLVVAQHGAGSAEADLAHFAQRKLLAGVLIHDLHIGLGERKTEAVFFVQLVAVGAGAGSHFAHAVPAAEFHIFRYIVFLQELVEFRFPLRGKGFPAAGEVDQAGQVSGGLLYDLFHHAGRAGKVVGFQTVEFRADLHRIHGEPQSGLDPYESGQLQHSGAVGQERGEDIQIGLAPLEMKLGVEVLFHHGVDVMGGQHHALGFSGGAAGVDDDGGSVGILGRLRKSLILRTLHKLCVGGIGVFRNGVLCPVSGAHRFRHGVGDGKGHDGDVFRQTGGHDRLHGLVHDEVYLGSRHCLALPDLRGRQRDIDHVGHRTEIADGVIEIDGLRGVHGLDGHQIPSLHAGLFQRTGGTPDLLKQRSVGDGVAVIAVDHTVGIVPVLLFDKPEQGPFRDLHAHGLGGVVAQPRPFHRREDRGRGFLVHIGGSFQFFHLL